MGKKLSNEQNKCQKFMAKLQSRRIAAHNTEILLRNKCNDLTEALTRSHVNHASRIETINDLKSSNMTLRAEVDAYETRFEETDETGVGSTSCVICMQLKPLTLFHYAQHCGHVVCSQCALQLGYTVRIIVDSDKICKNL